MSASTRHSGAPVEPPQATLAQTTCEDDLTVTASAASAGNDLSEDVVWVLDQSIPTADSCSTRSQDAINGRIRFHLAISLAQSGELEESLSLFESLMGTAAAHYNVGRISYDQGQWDDSRHHLQSAVDLDPSLAQARYWLSRLPGTPQLSMQ